MSATTPTQPVLQFNTGTAQYAVKKRRRPQAKKNKNEDDEPKKSNPSKRHRDRLNNELEDLSKLIPFTNDVLSKLDKLSVLRLAVSYLRNKSYHSIETANSYDELGQLVPNQVETQVSCFQEPESKLALEALHGFLVVVSQDFSIFYVTDSVQDYLGFPQSDMMNLSILDFVHVDDREIFMRQMKINQKSKCADLKEEGQASTVPEYVNMGMTADMFKQLSQDGLMNRSFICRLRCLPDTSSGFLALHFTGHLRLIPGQNKINEQKVTMPPELGLFLLASPLQSPSIIEIRTKNFIFRTKHRLDYTPLGIDAKGKIVLGYTEQQLRQRSGYEFIHSADMMHCADAHTKLMRLGESGYTVFRLLHKDNRWVWVTASARLVYKHGQPDCIIATQRPIQDQEGEEHMKKRGNAFRFDFTGQAILYGEVNPIGTRGGPEKNLLEESAPAIKKQRLIDQSEVDRTSLYGAQAMQSMNIYMGNFNEEFPDSFKGRSVLASAGVVQNLIKNEQIGDRMGPIANESQVTFYPMGTDLSAEQQQQFVKPTFQNPNNCPSQGGSFRQKYAQPNHSMQPSPSFSMDCNDTPSHSISPLLLQSPEGKSTSPIPVQQENVLKRPFPGTNNAVPGQTQMHISPRVKNTIAGKAMPQNNMMMSKQQQPYYQQQTQQQLLRSQSQNDQLQQQMPLQTQQLHHQSQQLHQQPPQLPSETQQQDIFSGRQTNVQPVGQKQQAHMQFQNLNNERVSSNTAVNQKYMQDVNSLREPVPHFQNKYIKQAPSVLQAMTIDSVVSMNQMNQPQRNVTNLSQETILHRGMSIPNEYDVPQCIGSQDNTIRFDLQKVAADYQTTDPLSKVQEYLHNHPAQAAAIATGIVPENMQTETHKDFMPSCRYEQRHQIDSSNQIGSQFASFPPSNMSNSSNDLLSFGEVSEDDSVYRIPSISSNNSMSVSSLQDGASPMNELLTKQSGQF